MASTATEASAGDDVEETRLLMCEEFASITGSDTAAAQCYLAENDWEMEVINAAHILVTLWKEQPV